MPLALRQAFHDLRTGSDDESLEQRLYRLLCLATAVLLFAVVLPINLVEGTSVWLNVTVAAFGVITAALFALAPRGVLAIRTYLALIVIVLNIAWFTDGGMDGSIGYFFFAAVVYTGIFFRGAARWIYLALFLLDGLALLVLGYLHPDWVINFNSPIDRLLDLMTGLFVSMLGLTLMIWVLRTGFDGERRRQEELNHRLADALDLNQRRSTELAASLAEVKTLRGLLPICSNCKSVRDDAGLWSAVEQYVSSRSDASFTHSLCPDCLRKLYPNYADAVLAELNRGAASTTDSVLPDRAGGLHQG